ncbi:MAG TPA: hypothetical protein VM324_15625 [Egibacteraceae bacterium]|nr:hypothetical protein [Egibacteraceae bacterium]
MTDAHHPNPSAPGPGDGELMAAYLSGDLDDATAAVLERRLPDEPELARLLDDTARVLVALRGVDEVAAPPGAGERLRLRLAAEAAEPRAAAAVSEPADGGGEPVAVAALSSRRRAVPWAAVAGVAAGLAAFALVGGGLVQGFGDRGTMPAEDSATDTDVAMEESAGDSGVALEEHGGGAGESAGDSAQRSSASADGAREPAAAPFGDQQLSAPPPTGRAPLVVDAEIALAGPNEVRARYTAAPEATSLLGEPLPAAVERAAVYRGQVAAAEAFRSGVHPGDCLDDVGEGSPLLPARVESATFAGQPALVYLLVRANPDAAALDRVEAWVVEPEGCVTRLALDVT